jgi:hypothetical protein
VVLGANSSRNVSAKPRLDADYGLAVIAVMVSLAALAYVPCCWPGPSLGQQVYASTAGPPPPHGAFAATAVRTESWETTDPLRAVSRSARGSVSGPHAL